MSEVEVPFDRYLQFCYGCWYNKETDIDEVLRQYTLFPDERGNVKVRCSKYIPCVQSGFWEAEYRLKLVPRRKLRRLTKLDVSRMVLSWASKNRAEEGVHGYYQTKQFQRVLNLLKMVPEGMLVGVMGYSGQGKTAFIRALGHYLKPFYEESEPKVTEEVEEFEGGKIIRRDTRPDFIVSIPKWDSGVFKRFSAKVHKHSEMKAYKAFLIDTPDYGRKDIRRINQDLTQISEWWSDLRWYGCMANVVVFLQRELVRAQQHFFLLKMSPLIELKPLKPEEMVEFYNNNFNSCKPFTEDSLTLIAELSKGIFRRFMRYIQLAIQDMLEKERDVVSVEDVHRVITDDVLMKDMELEFWDMFRSESKKQTAFKIISFLRLNKETTQTQIAEAVGVNEATISRIIPVLEDNGYVKRKRVEHGRWLVSLK